VGYTHYWQQLRDHSKATWEEIRQDVTAILNDVQHVQGIPLANGLGEPGTQPEVTGDKIWFNGVGPDDDHETLSLWRKRPPLEAWQSKDRRGGDFCKTARKPYDLAVTAVLAYMESIHGLPVSSDGDGAEWLEGVEEARRALPRYANQIDIPLEIRKGDRWDWRKRPTSYLKAHKYRVEACIDGHAYVFERENEANSYRFDTPEEALAYLQKFKEPKIRVRSQWAPGGYSEEGGQPLFETSGSYDEARHKRLERAQTKILKALVDNAELLGRRHRPPAFARPLVMPAEAREKAGSLADLFNLVGA
jgi:hypothetical protein